MKEQSFPRRARAELDASDLGAGLATEWLLTNGLGGYASGTICGACTRRYHGLLIAALPPPLGRHVMFDHLGVEVEFEEGRVECLDLDELPPDPSALPPCNIGAFHLVGGLPVWTYEFGPYVLEKRILLPHLQNTVCIWYRLIRGPGSLKIRLCPSVHFRRHDAPLRLEVPRYTVAAMGERIEFRSEAAPPLRMIAIGAPVTVNLDGGRRREVHYGREQAHGYEYRGGVWSPGHYAAELTAGDEVMLVASTDDWEVLMLDPSAVHQAEIQRRSHLLSRAQPVARRGYGAELVLAADQFIIRPVRLADESLAAAAGEEARSIIAGYHWFTDWGRDTMISLEGLTLVTGRHDDARYLLHTFARYVRDGLIPNLFPEGEREGLYHTADATLWYFHALARYLAATRDQETLELLLPTLFDIVAWHVRGTHFGIHVDPADGLLAQGAAGYQLTWMDAKVGDWVVTPRRGKAVEINALWYNALRLLEVWCRELGDEAAATAHRDLAARAQESFHRRFWYAQGEYLYDVVDGEHGDEHALRPNQLFAISLDHPVLEAARWLPVFEKVRDRLLTPFGLRTLVADHPDYKRTYDGDIRARDAAYHQGTVWAWLIGPYIDAWLRIDPGKIAEAAGLLESFERHAEVACVGSISEIFDAEPPFHARGCVAQAWSVAEVLRCWARIHAAAT